jgi:hypothetical protein
MQKRERNTDILSRLKCSLILEGRNGGEIEVKEKKQAREKGKENRRKQ